MSYITAIGTANPVHRFPQSAIAEFMLRAMQFTNGESRKLKAVFRASGIEYRHSVLDDYGKVRGFAFYPNSEDLEPFPGTQQRLQAFRTHALGVSVSAVDAMLAASPETSLEGVTHLIVVCCTGMYAPGLDIDLINALKLSPTVQRTAINFMGCHAAFNAMKIADACCKSDAAAKALIVCTELCSLHFQRRATEDNILANALFADGSASLLIEAHPRGSIPLKIEQFQSALETEGMSDMAWTIGNMGFEMRLSSYVPDLIRKGISQLGSSVLANVVSRDIRHFAIHPGGKRILEVVEEELGITKAQNDPAYYVLKNYGNMSSPTVLFVLRNILDRLHGSNHGDRVLAMAFGPGLTIESMVLKIEKV